MKILIDMGHPGHVHLFKNAIWNLEKRGHKVKITARQKEITLDLLKAYGFEYEDIGTHRSGLFNKAKEMIKIDYKMYNIVKKFKPDVLVSVGSMYSAHVSKLIGKPAISFEDTETSGKIQFLLYIPFTDTICTPSCFKKNFGLKQVHYRGYHELAYLHPNYFKPDSSFFEELDLHKNDKFIILRFISWAASHDIELKGIKKGSEIEFIRSLEQYGKVFITSERKLDKTIEKYKITTSPDKIHSLLNFAQLYIGEGGTMAVESAILGTPAIHIESTSSGAVSAESSGNFLELRDKYNLLYMFSNQEEALEKAAEILENKNSKNEWKKKREKLLKDKIDVTAWMTNFIEKYPESFYEYKNKEKNDITLS